MIWRRNKIEKLSLYDKALLFVKRRVQVLVERDRLRFDLEEAKRHNRWLASENFQLGREIIYLKSKITETQTPPN